MDGEKPNNLLEIRKGAGLSRRKAAKDLDIDTKTLYRYENGTQCPNVYTAIRLAEYYHRTIKELFPSNDGI
jgi:DNA-binding XRE family transcriptional regulator